MGLHTFLHKRCPKCGKEYKFDSAYGPYGKETFYEFGPIFVTCRNCGAVFRDKYRYELAVMSPPAEMLRKFHPSSIVVGSLWILVGLVYFLVTLFEKGSIAPGSPLLLLICLVLGGGTIWGDYSRYKSNVKKIETEKELSVKRLKSDPQYVAQLEAAGFRIPPELKNDNPNS